MVITNKINVIIKIKIDPDSVEALTKNKPIKLKEARISVAFESNVIFIRIN